MVGLSETSWVYLIIAAMTVLFGLLGWLLTNKDARQEESIRLLFKKHDEDVEELHRLQRELDRDYYPKSELNPKFDALLLAVNRLADEFKLMSNRLMEHMITEEVNK